MASVVPRRVPASKNSSYKTLQSSRKTMPSSKSGAKAALHQSPRTSNSKKTNVNAKTSSGVVRVDATHMIRVNVLGLAGITVDRKKCRDLSRNRVSPVQPKEMRAVVAFSRGQQIRGTTTLSKALTRSPNDDIVVTGNVSEDDLSLQTQSVRKSKRDDETMTHVTEYNKVQRHVAVWATDDDLTLGSMVTFDACLRRLDQGNSTATSSTYAPKSFELTIALTEHTKSENKVALPFGVANLNISGDECPNGETIVLDLPVLSLMQARPLASNKNGLGSYQMIAIRPKKNAGDRPEPTKKRGGLKRLFGRSGSENKVPRIPSISERKAFSDAYSTDASGDAILRVQLQVVEKGSLAQFQNLDYRVKSSITPAVTASTPKKDTIEDVSVEKSSLDGQNKKSESKTVLRKEQDGEASIANSLTESSVTEQAGSLKTASFSDESSAGSTTGESDSGTMLTNESASMPSNDSETLVSNDGETLQSSHSDTIEAVRPGAPEDAEMNIPRANSIADEKPPTGAFDSQDEADGTDNGKSSSIREGEATKAEVGDDLHLAVIKVFGREVRIPSCGPLAMRMTEEGPKAQFFNDDVTHVTADFFGRDVPIPICAAIKPHDDDDTITLQLNETFSTISDNGSGSQRKDILRSFLRSQKATDGIRKPDAWGTNPEEDLSTVDATLDTAMEGTLDGSLDPTLDRTLDDTLEGTEGEASASLDHTSGEDDTLVGSQRGSLPSGSVQQQPIELVVKGSPKGVADVVQEEMVESKVSEKKPQVEKQEPAPTMSEKFAQIFHCGPSTVDDKKVPYKSGVPGMVIPDDSNSVGDLTASTHELKINKKKQIPKSRAGGMGYLPVAFGGSGMCSSIQLSNELERAAGIEMNPSRSSLSKRSTNENYFSEYDDYSFRDSIDKSKHSESESNGSESLDVPNGVPNGAAPDNPV